jgi:hypothetical protein
MDWTGRREEGIADDNNRRALVVMKSKKSDKGVRRLAARRHGRRRTLMYLGRSRQDPPQRAEISWRREVKQSTATRGGPVSVEHSRAAAARREGGWGGWGEWKGAVDADGAWSEGKSNGLEESSARDRLGERSEDEEKRAREGKEVAINNSGEEMGSVLYQVARTLAPTGLLGPAAPALPAPLQSIRSHLLLRGLLPLEST